MESSEAPSPAHGRRRTILLAVGKIGVSAALIAWILSSIDTSAIVARIQRISPSALVLASACEILALFLAAWRWQLILGVLDVRARFVLALRLFYVGQFINQVLPANIGGDIYRVWSVFSGERNLLRALMAVALDRVVALAGLALLAVPGIYTLYKLPDARVPALIMIALVGGIIVAIAAFLAFGTVVPSWIARLLPRLAPLMNWLAEASRLARAVFLGPVVSPLVVALAVAVQGLTVAAFLVLARGLGIELGIGIALALIPPVILASVVPVSYGGWGVREGAMAASLGLVGIAPEAAISLSLLFGGLLFVLSLPAGLWWAAAAARPSAGRD